jgi:hypothetical protein
VVVAEPGCDRSSDTQYIPTQSWVTFERDDLRVSLRKQSTLRIEVTSSNGDYNGTYVEPTTSIYEGLQVTTTIGFDWVWDMSEERFVLKPGQVKAILRVWDCWRYVEGPADLF